MWKSGNTIRYTFLLSTTVCWHIFVLQMMFHLIPIDRFSYSSPRENSDSVPSPSDGPAAQFPALHFAWKWATQLHRAVGAEAIHAVIFPQFLCCHLTRRFILHSLNEDGKTHAATGHLPLLWSWVCSLIKIEQVFKPSQQCLNLVNSSNAMLHLTKCTHSMMSHHTLLGVLLLDIVRFNWEPTSFLATI